MPVLPEVASIRVSPGLISPRSSARRIMLIAGRSLTEPAEDDVAAGRVLGTGKAHQADQRRGADHVLDRRIGRRGITHGEGGRMPWCLGSESNRNSSRNGILSPA